MTRLNGRLTLITVPDVQRLVNEAGVAPGTCAAGKLGASPWSTFRTGKVNRFNEITKVLPAMTPSFLHSPNSRSPIFAGLLLLGLAALRRPTTPPPPETERIPVHRDDPRCRVRGSVPVAGGPGQRGDAGLHRPAERVRRGDRRRAPGARVGAAAAAGTDRHAGRRLPEQGRRVRTLHPSPGRRGAGVHRAPAGAGGRGGRAREDRPGGRVRGR